MKTPRRIDNDWCDESIGRFGAVQSVASGYSSAGGRFPESFMNYPGYPTELRVLLYSLNETGVRARSLGEWGVYFLVWCRARQVPSKSKPKFVDAKGAEKSKRRRKEEREREDERRLIGSGRATPAIAPRSSCRGLSSHIAWSSLRLWFQFLLCPLRLRCAVYSGYRANAGDL